MGYSPSYIRTGFRIRLWASPHIDLVISAEFELMDSGSEWQLDGDVRY
jgi:hypothetical protein